jgi:protein-S-isoprenylcysteine O-methyltransferase Ste14
MTLALATAFSLLVFAAMAALLFVTAGRCDLPALWVYLAVTILPSLFVLLLLNRRSPDLIKERLHPGPGEQDRISIVLLSFALAIHLGLAGLDVGRVHWSGSMSLVVQVAGFVGYTGGLGLSMWAMLVNRFFSSAVRIQADRGQYVITEGPYRYVRHPGYTGGILYLLCSGLALGSWWSILPMPFAIWGVIRRTVIEDRLLYEKLPGYTDYAQKVPYRLIPGVW